MRQKDRQLRQRHTSKHLQDKGETMKVTPIIKVKPLNVLLIGTVLLISIMRAQNGVDTKEIWKMGTIVTLYGINVGIIVWMRLKSLTQAKNAYAGNLTKAGRPDMILLGSFATLQPNDPTQIPTTTVVLVIAMILFLFIVGPYLIGKVLSQSEWTEEEEAMGAELPQWDASDNWTDLFPRYLAGDTDGQNRTRVTPKK